MQKENKDLCSHFKSGCMIECPTCETFYPCRLCHDTVMMEEELDPEKNHKMPKDKPIRVKCKECDLVQEMQEQCSGCRIKFSTYYCPTCVIYDDNFTMKGGWHCDQCNVCKMGGKENYFHCEKCQMCWEKDQEHICNATIRDEECAMCMLKLDYKGLQSIQITEVCRHAFHVLCLYECLQSEHKSCPICRKEYPPTMLTDEWQQLFINEYNEAKITNHGFILPEKLHRLVGNAVEVEEQKEVEEMQVQEQEVNEMQVEEFEVDQLQVEEQDFDEIQVQQSEVNEMEVEEESEVEQAIAEEEPLPAALISESVLLERPEEELSFERIAVNSFADLFKILKVTDEGEFQLPGQPSIFKINEDMMEHLQETSEDDGIEFSAEQKHRGGAQENPLLISNTDIFSKDFKIDNNRGGAQKKPLLHSKTEILSKDFKINFSSILDKQENPKEEIEFFPAMKQLKSVNPLSPENIIEPGNINKQRTQNISKARGLQLKYSKFKRQFADEKDFEKALEASDDDEFFQEDVKVDEAILSIIDELKIQRAQTAHLHKRMKLQFALSEQQMRRPQEPQMLRQKETFNFAFLFACPLVSTEPGELVSEKKLEKDGEMMRLDSQSEYQLVRKTVEEANASITLSKVHGTVPNFSEVIYKGPQALHWSGHGSDQALFFETEECLAKKVGEPSLKALLKPLKNNLSFVFVAACHSEQAKDCFLNAGADHVIVIDKEQMILDKAIITFTHTFYSRIFQPGSRVCECFEQAVTDVRIAHKSESDKFQLFKSDEHKHEDCPVFGNFQRGVPEFQEPSTFLRDMPPKILIIGRTLEQAKLLLKVLSPDSQDEQSRLVTITGSAGIGKSALACATLHFVQERALFKGGCIYVDVRQIENVGILEQKIIQVIVKDSSGVLKNFSSEEDKKLDEILDEIKRKNLNFLFLFDNVEDLILYKQNKDQFKTLIDMILVKIPKSKVLLTSRKIVGFNQTFSEETFELQKLSATSCVELFKKHTRDITQDIQELVKSKVKSVMKEKFRKHKLFELLAGNPQAIILTAPLLSDRRQNRTLKDLVGLLEQNKLDDIKIEDLDSQMNQAISTSLRVSTSSLLESDPSGMKLFLMTGLLNDQIWLSELKKFWSISGETNKIEPILKKLEQANLIKLSDGLEAHSQVSMTKAVKQCSQQIVSKEQSTMIHDLIVKENCDLMRHFYLHHKTQSVQTAPDNRYIQGLSMLIPIDQALTHTFKLIREKRLEEGIVVSESQHEYAKQRNRVEKIFSKGAQRRNTIRLSDNLSEFGEDRGDELDIDEQFILFFCANILMLEGNFQFDELLKELGAENGSMKVLEEGPWSKLFLANLYRLRAFRWQSEILRIMSKLSIDDAKEVDCDIILDNLRNAMQLFSSVKNEWGRGLCELQLGRFYMLPSQMHTDKAQLRLLQAARCFGSIKHIRGIQMSQLQLYTLLDELNKNLIEQDKHPAQSQQKLDDIHEEYTLAQIEYITLFEDTHDVLEELCSIERIEEDNMYALDMELVLFSNIQSIYRKTSESYKPTVVILGPNPFFTEQMSINPIEIEQIEEKQEKFDPLTKKSSSETQFKMKGMTKKCAPIMSQKMSALQGDLVMPELKQKQPSPSPREKMPYVSFSKKTKTAVPSKTQTIKAKAPIVDVKTQLLAPSLAKQPPMAKKFFLAETKIVYKGIETKPTDLYPKQDTNEQQKKLTDLHYLKKMGYKRLAEMTADFDKPAQIKQHIQKLQGIREKIELAKNKLDCSLQQAAEDIFDQHIAGENDIEKSILLKLQGNYYNMIEHNQEKALHAYQQASEFTLPASQTLSLATNFSKFTAEVLKNKDEAVKIAKSAMQKIGKKGNDDEVEIRMDQLRTNLLIWATNL